MDEDIIWNLKEGVKKIEGKEEEPETVGLYSEPYYKVVFKWEKQKLSDRT